MSKYSLANDFSHQTTPKVGVLLTNLGTPDAPTVPALRRYLAEFLWDPRIVDIPRPLWWLILHGIILRRRPARSAAAYQKVWTEQGSPLLVISERQRTLIAEQLAERCGGTVEVVLGMRYGNPSIASALEVLRDANVQRLLILPLYPQYSCASTASTFDAIAATFRRWRWIPDHRFIGHYHDEPAYIMALANSIRESWSGRERGERLIFSFHGTPRSFLEQGDPYYCHCQKSARLVVEELGLADGEWLVTFQSRFGRQEWLKPYTDATLQGLAMEGVKRVDVISPAFSADCLETLEELAVENSELFRAAGGESLHYIEALNDRPDHIKALTDLVIQQMQGWPVCRDDAPLVEGEAATQRAARANRMMRK